MSNACYGPAEARVWDGGNSWSLLWHDRYARVRAQFLFCAIATLVDAVGTVVHLSRGAWEANPIWAAVIGQAGVVSAMGIRLVVGLLLLAVLLALWRHPLARLGFTVTLIAFVPLTLYHILLFLVLPVV